MIQHSKNCPSERSVQTIYYVTLIPIHNNIQKHKILSFHSKKQILGGPLNNIKNVNMHILQFSDIYISF